MATIKRFEDLECWQTARELCKLIYKITNKELFSKDFSLKDQIRRSGGSIMDNIAEGFERDGNREFINFLSISKSSAGEVRSQVYRAFDQSYISQHEFEEVYNIADRVGQMNKRLMQYLLRSDFKGEKFKSNNPKTLNA